MTFTMTYETRNMTNLNQLADNTKAGALKLYEYAKSIELDVLIYETIRTEAQQRQYVAEGKSTTMRSYHLVGQALDFVPVDGKTCLWSGYGSTKAKQFIAKAKSLGFEWGGDWTSFIDKPHLQYSYHGYGTDTYTGTASSTTSTEAISSGATNNSGADSTIKKLQEWLNKNYSSGLSVDGIYGSKTKKAAIKAYQKIIGVTVDGIFGAKSKAAVKTLKSGSKGNAVYLLQGMLYCAGHNPKGFDGFSALIQQQQ